MIKNFFKIGWRNIIRHKTHTAINVVGLALGMTCCLFIYLWVQDEQSIDNFHANGNSLYTVYKTVAANGQLTGSYETPSYMSNQNVFVLENLKTAISEVKNVALYTTGYELPWGHLETLQAGEKKMKLEGSRAGEDFFKMFSYKLAAGNPQTILKDMKGIAISRKLAEIFFGSPQKAMGQSMRFENKLTFLVTGVFENITAKSSLQFDFLLNWEAQKKLLDFPSSNIRTFVQLSETADVAKTEARINSYMQTSLFQNQNIKTKVGLQRFGNQYLHNIFVNGKPAGGRIEYVNIFNEVAIFILIIACINFMNLATARSVKRAKEVGVRKVAGSTRGNLIAQFFGESLLFSFLAMLLSVVLLYALLPAFNNFTGKQFEFPAGQVSFWAALTGLMIITGLIAGSYPALYLSSLKPASVLKGVLRFTQGAVWFRKGLTVFQFALSIILLIATIVITRQTNYVQNAHLGYNRENLIYIRVEGNLIDKNKYLLFKEQAMKMPGITMVDRSSEAPHAMDFVVNWDAIKWQGKEKNAVVSIKPASVGFDFVKVMGLQIVQGRDFSHTFPTDSIDAFLVNEAAVKQMGMKNPIGQWVSAWDKKGHIIGVLKDYHTQSLHEAILPVMIDVKEGENFGVFLIRTKPGQTKQALQSLETLYKSANPDYPFSYQFVDEEYKKLYSSELIISQLSIIFAAVAIIISCLGLLGLVMFSAEQRIKELGVRKVLGASVNQLVALFAQDFLKLILIAFLIASPLAWFAMNRWMQSFAYKTEISWWIFALSGSISLIIAFVIMSYEAFKAALTNPVKSLRSE
ncbi:ABC transporter permease [Mucilaginibacter sp.]|uniref:ABC transporter permease n=1 Tax=Mucilaginibacter sp. TaxID=1882438 RepID=UPI0026386D55|nr:ABC transporter permease [Mucilaginibacter sp.]MDB4920127.1 FtsX-like permease family protein [Mucilaginibacter sp.]